MCYVLVWWSICYVCTAKQIGWTPLNPTKYKIGNKIGMHKILDKYAGDKNYSIIENSFPFIIVSCLSLIALRMTLSSQNTECQK